MADRLSCIFKLHLLDWVGYRTRETVFLQDPVPMQGRRSHLWGGKWAIPQAGITPMDPVQSKDMEVPLTAPSGVHYCKPLSGENTLDSLRAEKVAVPSWSAKQKVERSFVSISAGCYLGGKSLYLIKVIEEPVLPMHRRGGVGGLATKPFSICLDTSARKSLYNSSCCGLLVPAIWLDSSHFL